MEHIGWGLIGIGRIVKTRVAPAIVAEPRARLVAGVSRDQERADAFVQEFGAARGYSRYEDLLADPEVDVVFIATPNAQHAEQVIQAAHAGKHVLCDKPLATSVEDAVRAVEECDRAGVRLGINFHYRRMPWAERIRTLIGDGMIGDITSIRVQAGAGVRAPTSWRADPDLAGLGVVHNVGIHLVDLLRFVLGDEPSEVTAMFDEEGIGTTVESEVHSLVRFAGGALAYVTCNQTVPYPENDVAFYGTRGSIIGENLTRAHAGRIRVITDGGEEVIETDDPQAHHRTVVAFNEAIADGTAFEANGADGIHSCVFASATATSVREMRRVTVDPTPARR